MTVWVFFSRLLCVECRLAHANAEMLRSDKDAHYDEVIHIDLNKLVPHVNGPFTPDLASPIDKLGANALAGGACLFSGGPGLGMI